MELLALAWSAIAVVLVVWIAFGPQHEQAWLAMSLIAGSAVWIWIIVGIRCVWRMYVTNT